MNNTAISAGFKLFNGWYNAKMLQFTGYYSMLALKEHRHTKQKCAERRCHPAPHGNVQAGFCTDNFLALAEAELPCLQAASMLPFAQMERRAGKWHLCIWGTFGGTFLRKLLQGDINHTLPKPRSLGYTGVCTSARAVGIFFRGKLQPFSNWLGHLLFFLHAIGNGIAPCSAGTDCRDTELWVLWSVHLKYSLHWNPCAMQKHNRSEYV